MTSTPLVACEPASVRWRGGSSSPVRPLVVPWPWIALLLVGFPLLMTARSAAWRAIGPEGLPGLGYYVPFWLTVIVLQALSTVLVLRAMRASGSDLAGLGLRVGARRASITIALIVGLGIVLIAYRELTPAPTSVAAADPFASPTTLSDRCVWLVEALMAAFCEELLYRGFAITALAGRGLPLLLAVLIAVVPWLLNHGLTGLERAPFYVITGLLLGALYAWRRSLYPNMVLHTLLALMTLLG
jgi:membrane protease YdiL (CAAX protease family)